MKDGKEVNAVISYEIVTTILHNLRTSNFNDDDDDDDLPRQIGQVPLDAAGSHDRTFVVGNEVVIRPMKMVLPRTAAAERRQSADEAPGDAGQHDQYTETHEADSDDRRRAMGVDGVRDGDRDGSDQHEADTDSNSNQRSAV